MEAVFVFGAEKFVNGVQPRGDVFRCDDARVAKIAKGAAEKDDEQEEEAEHLFSRLAFAVTPSGASLASFAVFFTGRVGCRGSCGGIIGFFVLFRRCLGCSLFAEGQFRRGSFCFFSGTVYLFCLVGCFGCRLEGSFFLCLCWFFVLDSCCDGEGNRERGRRNNYCFVGRFGRRCCRVSCLLLSSFGFRDLCFGSIHSRFRLNSCCCYFSNCRFCF